MSEPCPTFGHSPLIITFYIILNKNASVLVILFSILHISTLVYVQINEKITAILNYYYHSINFGTFFRFS